MDAERSLQEAMAHHEAGRLVEAEAGYRELIRVDPRNVDALHFLGYLLFQRGEPRGAADLSERSLAVNAANPRALLNLALVRLALGEREAAAAALRDAVRLQP